MDRFGARSLDEVLASIAVSGTDPEAVSEYVVGRLAASRRRSRMLVVLAAVLVVLAVGTAFALSGGGNPDEVVAPAPDSTDRTSGGDADSELPEAGSGSVVTAVPTTVPTTTPLDATAVPSIAGANSKAPTKPRPARGGSSPAGDSERGEAAAPATTGTTAPPDAPLEAAFETVAADSVAVGDVVTVTLFWSDPDLPEGTVATARLLGGDNGALTKVDGPCTGGTGASGIVRANLSFAEAKSHTVAIEVSTCGGSSQTFATEVDVGQIEQGRRPVRVKLPRAANPEVGTWTFIPDESGSPVVIRDAPAGNEGALRMFDGDFAVSVLAVPGVQGTIRHTGADCKREAHIDAATTEVGLTDCLG